MSARGWEQIPTSAGQCGQTAAGVTDRQTWRMSCGAPAGPLPVCPSPSDGPETWGRGAASGRRLAWSRRLRCSQGHRRPRVGGGACLSATTLEAGGGNKSYFGHHAKLFVFSRPSGGIYFTSQEASVNTRRSGDQMSRFTAKHHCLVGWNGAFPRGVGGRGGRCKTEG